MDGLEGSRNRLLEEQHRLVAEHLVHHDSRDRWRLEPGTCDYTLDDLLREADSELRQYEPTEAERDIMARHPELEWLARTPPTERSLYATREALAVLLKMFKGIAADDWRALLRPAMRKSVA